MNWFFVADWHLDHSNIIKYCNRPFMSQEEKELYEKVQKGEVPERDLKISWETTAKMTTAIIDNTNAVVGVNDHLIVVGDSFFSSRKPLKDQAKKLRERINCKNLYLVLGNHDDYEVCKPLFKEVYEQHFFKIGGQQIFVSHYPCRSWIKAHWGTYMLYGHVHNLYQNEDNGLLSPYTEYVLSKSFLEIFANNHYVECDQIVKELLRVVASLNGADLTLDIGVDNRIRGDQVPFGTPWSMDEINQYMSKKKVKWLTRQESYKSFFKNKNHV